MVEQILLTESDLLIEDICEMLFTDAEPYLLGNDKENIHYKTGTSKWASNFSYIVKQKTLFIPYDSLKLIHNYIPERLDNIVRGFVLWFQDKYNKKVNGYQIRVTNSELQLSKEEYNNTRKEKYTFSGSTFIEF